MPARPAEAVTELHAIMTGLHLVDRRKHPALAGAASFMTGGSRPAPLRRRRHENRRPWQADAPANQTPHTAIANEDPHGHSAAANTRPLCCAAGIGYAEPGRRCRKPGGRARFTRPAPGRLPGLQATRTRM